ncbi:DUF6752 domain-containing protein [Nocardioides sp.]|uniref:DUF6752 domain-containing protein n=1 Tax=Nocardioides sp. TaxID=35761 RepID=UPI003516277E
MSDAVRNQGGRFLKRLRDASEDDLKRRVEELEAEVQECRRLNRRLAELMDVVEELLVPLAQRDEAAVRAYLDSHRTPL